MQFVRNHQARKRQLGKLVLGDHTSHSDVGLEVSLAPKDVEFNEVNSNIGTTEDYNRQLRNDEGSSSFDEVSGECLFCAREEISV